MVKLWHVLIARELMRPTHDRPRPTGGRAAGVKGEREMDKDKLTRLHYSISDHLVAIEKFFNQPTKITLVIRTPELEDGGVLIMNDEPELAIAEINRLSKRAPVVGT